MTPLTPWREEPSSVVDDFEDELRQIEMAERAVQVVLTDLHRTTDRRPIVTVDSYSDGLRLTVGMDYVGPSIDRDLTEPEMVQEVADYLQDQVMRDHVTVWPTCPRHNIGLHPDLVDGVATWCCRYGGHQVATIGELAAG